MARKKTSANPKKRNSIAPKKNPWMDPYRQRRKVGEVVLHVPAKLEKIQLGLAKKGYLGEWDFESRPKVNEAVARFLDDLFTDGYA